MDINLKSCPFCGGEAKIRMPDHFNVFVECVECDARTRIIKSDMCYCARDRAVEFWNHRVPEGPEEELADPLDFLDTN